MTLNQLGWNPYFTAHFNMLDDSGLIPARIARQNKYDFVLLTEAGAWTGVLPGRLKNDPMNAQPAVGDWVAVAPVVGENKGVIQNVLPRKTFFSRKSAGETTNEQAIAANIDFLYVIVGLDRDFNVRRIERYLTQIWESGAVPRVVLNKADQCDETVHRLDEVRQSVPGVDVTAVSALTGEGIDRIQVELEEGFTAAFVGSSGVGKSTLINRLLGSDRLLTGAVRPDDQRGRHTTTFRELIVLPSGGIIIDTPGMRELRLWTEKEAVDRTFEDIEILARSCRFSDCSHGEEPGCAVRDALDQGDLSAARYRSYLKLQREIDYTERRQDEFFERNERARQREFSRMCGKIVRNSPKR